MRFVCLFWVLIAPTVACFAQNSSADTALHVDLDTLTVSAPATPPVYQATAPKVWEIIHTRIALTFDWNAKTAGVREWITLHPYFYATDTVVLDAKGMEIDSVQLAGPKGNRALSYIYQNDELKIHFPKRYKATDSVQVYLRYTAMPYKETSGGSAAITDDRGLYFINTDHKTPFKPSQIWTQGETQSNSHWMITIDKPNTRFTTQIELTVPDSCVTLATGAMVKQVKTGNGMHTDIWKIDMPVQAYAVMFAIGKYAVIKDKWKNKEVNYYVEPEYAPYARRMFSNTVEMMSFFSQRTGVPYPWNKYSQVVARDYVSGAMENTTASLFGEFMNVLPGEGADRHNEDVVSHELFHQWFGDYVTAESWSNLTVNESFANYGEQLWRRYKYGNAYADELAYNDLQGYLFRSQGHDPDLVRFYYDDREEMFDGISYNKGGAILRYLNTLIGDEAFDKAMNIYLTKNALHSAEAHNWRLAVEEATGQDWSWFFNQWYFHGGHPVLKVTYDYNDTTQKLSVTVSQVQPDSTFMFTMPLKAAVIYGNDKTVIDWSITKRKETFTYTYKNGVKPVIVPDYTHVVPGELKDIKKSPQWITQFTHTDDYISKYLAVYAAGRQISDSGSQALLDIALSDSTASIRRAALSQVTRGASDKYHKRWAPKAMAMATGDKDLLVRIEALDVLGDWKVKEAKQLFINAIRDSSFTLAGKALDGLDKLDKDTAYIVAMAALKAVPHGALETSIWTIIGNKGSAADIDFYEYRGPRVSGGKKVLFASSLNSYLKKVIDDEAFRRGIAVLRDMAIRENMKSYSSAIGKYLFGIAEDLRSKIKGDKRDEAEMAMRRMPVVKAACAELIAAEDNPEALKDFKKMMKTNFETDKK